MKNRNSMLVYCTYCSAEKNDAKRPISAIELYKSERITSVFNQAKINKSNFVILSGKYGLVDTHQKINNYDHQLVEPEVKAHAELVADQLKTKEIKEMVFYMRSMEEDKNLKPYLMCIQKACELAGVSLDIRAKEFLI